MDARMRTALLLQHTSDILLAFDGFPASLFRFLSAATASYSPLYRGRKVGTF